MIIYPHISLSVNKLVKALGNDYETRAEVTAGDSVHIFQRVIEDREGLSLSYETEDYSGNFRLKTYPIESRPSNLPGMDAERWYIYWRGHYVQKLHLRSFMNGAFFFVRHEYKHIYASQDYSKRQQSLKYHDYAKKINALIDSKQKLRLTYAGKPTRTAKRLDRYNELYDLYEARSYAELFYYAMELETTSTQYRVTCWKSSRT